MKMTLRILCVFSLMLFIGIHDTEAKTIKYEKVQLDIAQNEIPFEELLDVGIMIFDPNVPEKENPMIFPEIRKAEARYMPYHLKKTLENTGHWGGVWVLPERSKAIDLIIVGRIEKSDGLDVELKIGVWDVVGSQWINKTYESNIAKSSYSKRRDLTQDPYQNIFNKIANDLLQIKQSKDREALIRLSQTGEIRFASELIPVYDDYISKNKKNIYSLERLPSEDDEIMQRILEVQEREFLLLDTLNEYYGQLYENLSQPYEDWRKLSREDMITYEELQRSARTRKILGAVALAGALATDGDSRASSTMRQMAVYGGIEAMRSGFATASEAKIYQ
ncbi:MAG TPA: hypothetical protein QF540_02480, partial [Gammaproteobacteria bacterium]|nr:hypothetical protein [Gammaproteobacteria bacterium]